MVEFGAPLMLFLSSVIMAFAWLGHLRFLHWRVGTALFASWMLVLPEYMLNVFATRWGHSVYSGAQMATLNLSTGVICVALVSRFVLGEKLTIRQRLGFALMIVAIVLVVAR
ncbi:MAG: DMT family protein [Myxococcota bacterium]